MTFNPDSDQRAQLVTCIYEAQCAVEKAQLYISELRAQLDALTKSLINAYKSEI